MDKLLQGRFFWLAFGLFFCVSGVARAANDPEIISVVGKGDKRESAQADWVPAAPKQTVKPGGFIRTLDMSQMAILMPDRTQLRLNQNSQMQIKTQADAADWSQTTVKLNSGRAWSQARPAAAVAGSGTPPVKVSMETPSATLSIRGTDWEVEVTPDGRTQLVVLSGMVDIANEQGSLQVGAGEAAIAEIGKAPVRLILANPAERVQWVTAWQVQPRRWIRQPDTPIASIIAQIEKGDYAAATKQLSQVPASPSRDLLQADLAVMQGDQAQAIRLLKPHAQEGKDMASASVLLARVHLASGNAAAAAPIIEAATRSHPQDAEVWLAAADLAVLQGDAAAARQALGKALEIDGKHPDAWFARGSMETERENFRIARTSLDNALAARPEWSRAQAERGTLETLAGDFTSASRHYQQALQAAPDDYIALTGRGILKLKSGDSNGALEDFLRAGVIEPRYARAWLYSAIAFYQLGDFRRAEEALNKAIKLDPRDPLPHVMLGLIVSDKLDLGAAVDAARAAQERMPFLKSLNQVLNNQKGSANVGSSLAAFGMDEWARHYATTAYSPWWAGSHLFLADRSTSGYVKNSELFKGFITDPLVFGASQRHSSMVPTPGHHGRVDLFIEQADWQQNAVIGTANGLVNLPAQFAYFVSGDIAEAHSRSSRDAADATNLTLGLGFRPHHALGLFLFGSDTRTEGTLKNVDIPYAPISIDDTRADLGMNYKLDPNNQFWFKTGSGRNDALLYGQLVTGGLQFPLDQAHYRVRQSDVQLRHAFSPAENIWFSWGYESSHEDKPSNFDLRLTPLEVLAIAERIRLNSKDAYIVVRTPLTSNFKGEFGLFEQHANHSKFATQTQRSPAGDVSTVLANRERDYRETNWRGGLQWQYAPLSMVTAVAQNWRRPASAGSIAPIDTLGIPVNDRIVTNGGLYRRQRLQVDHESGQNTFFQGFIDREIIENLNSPLTSLVPDFQLSQLESLRNRRDAFSLQPELEEAPQFLEGKIRSFGFAVNHRLDRNQTLALRYRHNAAEQTGARDGLRIPYVPNNYLRLASHWSLPDRWLAGISATWRGERYRSERNLATEQIEPGWNFGLTGYWESADKRWVMQMILDNLRRNERSSNDSATKLLLRASYLF
jgi:tetratricopeptide (TPR) repeat protein